MLLNQYAIDETEAGVIRVAANVAGNGGPSHAYIATLAPAARRPGANSAAAARSLGETLQSVRFLGDRAYLVTFLQVVGNMIYDLSDPARRRARSAS